MFTVYLKFGPRVVILPSYFISIDNQQDMHYIFGLRVPTSPAGECFALLMLPQMITGVIPRKFS